jgi:hypothetical protein
MFADSTKSDSKVIRRHSIVEGFYNQLTKELKAEFRSLWMHHFNMTRESFYPRVARPRLEDYALIIYFMDGYDEPHSTLLDHFSPKFKYSDGKPYPTVKELLNENVA